MSAQTVDLEQLCPDKKGLKRDLKSRHLMMISVGGTIGTGLFLGSGQTISQAGPFGAILGYMVGGLVMLLVLLCLAELSTAMPVSGSFQSYASRFISPGAGFTTGWLYWVNWATCIAADFTAAGIIANNWFPQIPVWVWCAGFAISLALLNLISVKNYGEAEFWFAGIKVTAIIAFIIAGTALMFGSVGNEGAIGLSNFMQDQGIFPNGFFAVFLSMIAVVYSFQGAELVGIAAAECEEPGKNVPRVIKGVTLRIILFYVVAIFVLTATIPWKEAGVMESPFAHVFARTGIPFAETIMSAVVLTSALSAGNSALYACSRLLWSMSRENLAPAWLGKLNRNGVPFNGVLITLALAGLSLLTQVYAADTVYLWLMSSTGLTGCLIWVIIAWCQLNFRQEYKKMGGKVRDLIFRTPLYPLVPILTIVLNLGIIFSLYFDETQHIVLYAGTVVLAGIYGYYRLFCNGKKEAAVQLSSGK
ncbi:Amino-acid permease RocC [Sporomusa acidovorans DSM 3132]|uniref:Amino-acid permease RocC n=2 Tax=Sporomusa TaxID=2375 RepID=A0ABZ3J901_SPOA4|nr:amino acid permease [Sporomusa acidovorans]OZC24339.1 amino-acid permease RocC [Sporomusa acidovorans DSM 3132]SDF82092.1 arginine/ornithine permease [Sporomusa acidovorans]